MDIDTATESAFEAQHLDASMTWKTASWFAWDLETTGRDVRKDRPVQFGWASQEERGGPIKTGEVWINPRIPIDSAEFLQLMPEELEAIRIAPDFAEHAPYFLSTFRRESVLMGWNCGNRFDPNGTGYDCPMFATECKRVGAYLPTARVIDGMAVAAQTVSPRPEKWTLEAMAKQYGIEFPSQAHRAGADSFVTLSLMERIVGNLPDDLSAVHEVMDRWVSLSWWLRETLDGLEINCGQHRGSLLMDVARMPDRYGRRGGYLRWAMSLPDLPEAVRVEFRNATEAT